MIYLKDSKYYLKKQQRDNEVRQKALKKLNTYNSYSESDISNAQRQVNLQFIGWLFGTHKKITFYFPTVILPPPLN